MATQNKFLPVAIGVEDKLRACIPGVANIPKHCPSADLVEHIASVNQKDNPVYFLPMLLSKRVNGMDALLYSGLKASTEFLCGA
eukprot:15116078-Ditylum_brightwellii.AAC.1